jgi:hypothetical protein
MVKKKKKKEKSNAFNKQFSDLSQDLRKDNIKCEICKIEEIAKCRIFRK